MAILSIQSSVIFGYVGNSIARPVLQTLGYDVWCVDTVNFSNHPGYGGFTGSIKEAHKIQEDLKIQKGIKGIFSIDQSKRFKANVNVRLEIFRDQGKSIARASASRSQTLREDASPNLQSRLWYNLVELVMKSFDREMRHQINTHLKPYIS